jgi:hypothetical protein
MLLLVASVHYVVVNCQCSLCVLCVVEIHCVVTTIHHVTFPFYGKYYPYPYIVLQVEISLVAKLQQKLFHFKYVHLA